MNFILLWEVQGVGRCHLTSENVMNISWLEPTFLYKSVLFEMFINRKNCCPNVCIGPYYRINHRSLIHCLSKVVDAAPVAFLNLYENNHHQHNSGMNKHRFFQSTSESTIRSILWGRSRSRSCSRLRFDTRIAIEKIIWINCCFDGL